jgi:hypothetical protein
MKLRENEFSNRKAIFPSYEVDPLWSKKQTAISKLPGRSQKPFLSFSEAFPLIRMIRLLVLSSLFSIILGCGFQKPTLEVDLHDLLDDVQRKARIIRQFRTDFIKVRVSSVFRTPIVVSGLLIYQKPSIFSLRYRGDVNIEILSNGEMVSIIHNNGYRDTFPLGGDGNGVLVSDSVMTLIRHIGEDGLEKFPILRTERLEDVIQVEMSPPRNRSFQFVERVILWLSYLGEIKRIKVYFEGGDEEDTIFESWSVLAENEAEIIELEARLGEFPRL